MKGFWFWRELRTGLVYKYEFGVKPYNAENAWKRASFAEFQAQIKQP